MYILILIIIITAIIILPPELSHQTAYIRYPSNCQLKKYKLLRSIGTFPEATLLFSFYRIFSDSLTLERKNLLPYELILSCQ